ncbi:MAG TPA: hypothetical protein VJ719_10980 [Chthoniobacterales bacterium]|nr:hypothetical protein [Chthoniobacterales bacterium]
MPKQAGGKYRQFKCLDLRHCRRGTADHQALNFDSCNRTKIDSLGHLL